MSDDPPLKSAYELAMERLRAEDRKAGVEQAAPLSREQKKTIAELRSKAQARLAQIEILHHKDLAAVGPDPEQRAELEKRYATDRRRVQSALQSNIDRVRRNEPLDDADGSGPDAS